MQPGIEALSTATLELMKKGTSAFNNIRFRRRHRNVFDRAALEFTDRFSGRGRKSMKYYHDLPLLLLPPPSGVFPVRFDRYDPYFIEAD